MAQSDDNRAAAAVALRIAGAGYPDIANTLGYRTPDHARTAIETILRQTVTDEDKQLQTAVENERYNRMLQAVWPTVVNRNDPRNHEAIRTALLISKARRELLGLDAPTKHEVYTPTTEQIAAHVTKIREHIEAPTEPDIIDVDIIDDTDHQLGPA